MRKRFHNCIALLAICCMPALAADWSDPALKQELLAMRDSDQGGRAEMAQLRKTLPPNAPEMQAIWSKQRVADKANSERLAELVQANGWPARSVVGDQAANAAFLVLQHAGLPLQKRFLPLLREAFQQREADGQQLALLEDRVLVSEGRPQRYGSQMQMDPQTGKMSFFPIDDESHVDERRAAMGMTSLADYARHAGLIYTRPTE